MSQQNKHWLCYIIGHNMVHVIYNAFIVQGVRVYCKRCGQGPDAKPAADPAEPGEEVQDGTHTSP